MTYEEVPDWGLYGRWLYQERNIQVAEIVQELAPKHIFEFAGSGGFLAKEILDRYQPESYIHTDIHPEAVSVARETLSDYPNVVIKEYDVNRGLVPVKPLPLYLTVNFEHIRDDLHVIQTMQRGSTFVFCISNFYAGNHYNPMVGGVPQLRHRYEHLLDIKRVETFDWDNDTREKYIVVSERL